MRLTKTLVFSLFAFTMLTGANTMGNKDISVIYISSDGGKTWMPFDNGIPEDATVSSFLVVDDKIFATTDYDGVYSSREGDREWRRIDENLPDNVDVNAISTLQNVFVIGTRKHGVMISKDNGRHWDNPVVQINNTAVRTLHATGNTLFAGADNGIYRSFDNGNTWQHVWKDIQVNGFTEMNNTIYAAVRNGAVMTRDNGANWQYVYQPHTLHDISTDGQRIYAMTLGDGLQKSDNSGLAWENANNGLGKQKLYTFEVKRFNNKIFAAQWDGIYASEDWGKSWSLIKNGLPDSTAFTTLEATRSGLIAGIGLRKKQVRQ
ncbi:sialidase family protein [Chryseolinea sp. H1M3-3]|uniref:WD40/YVTN/BNR-like repeat-containing protein n=1 Tax=Chryseolinea sp. H1M3-3 TaxID=3034144 RepID=UPI0023EDD26E|nr:sialidase family protein [Chryseolinea sp. H1M3-3]